MFWVEVCQEYPLRDRCRSTRQGSEILLPGLWMEDSEMGGASELLAGDNRRGRDWNQWCPKGTRLTFCQHRQHHRCPLPGRVPGQDQRVRRQGRHSQGGHSGNRVPCLLPGQERATSLGSWRKTAPPAKLYFSRPCNLRTLPAILPPA
jgi:hypothetical protein